MGEIRKLYTMANGSNNSLITKNNLKNNYQNLKNTLNKRKIINTDIERMMFAVGCKLNEEPDSNCIALNGLMSLSNNPQELTNNTKETVVAASQLASLKAVAPQNYNRLINNSNNRQILNQLSSDIANNVMLSNSDRQRLLIKINEKNTTFNKKYCSWYWYW